jgi:signal transduction histidine kinase
VEPLIDILLVDDEPRNLNALARILSDRGYRLLRAEDADRALRLLLDHDVAVIVLDIQMPRVNGIEFAQIIKRTERFCQIPILFLTGYMLDDQDILTGYGVGGVDYLIKPFNPQILRQKVAVFAELFRKTRALAELNEVLEARVKERTAWLERSEAALQVAARAKDEFLAVLAHELRNPLAPLRTGVDLLMQQEAPVLPVVGRTLAAMNRQLEHLVRLIDDLLDVSRISRGVLELKKARVDLGATIHAAIDIFRSVFEQRKITLVVSIPHQISAAVDATRISQILRNLLHNASKFTPAGGTLRVELDFSAGNAVIRVSDNGIGIPPDQLERVFEMFVHIENQAYASDYGSGIGLALAKRLAQMHGGDLSAWSAGEGQGTTFTLTLPDADNKASATEAQAKPPRRLDPRTRFDILVIEDNDDVADTLTAWLQEMGHCVHVARTGASGVELALVTRPHIVLCDLGLPEMDGLEVCQRVRQLARDFRPIMVALTGWGNDEDRQRTHNAGFDHHLVKPVALDLLSEVLQRADRSRDENPSLP